MADGGAPNFGQMRESFDQQRKAHGVWFWATIVLAVVVLILVIYIFWTKDTMTPSNLMTGGNHPQWHKGSIPTDAHTAHQKSSHNVGQTDIGSGSWGDWSMDAVTAKGAGENITAAQRAAIQQAYLGPVGPALCSGPSAAAAEELQMAQAIGSVAPGV